MLAEKSAARHNKAPASGGSAATGASARPVLAADRPVMPGMMPATMKFDLTMCQG